MTYHIVIILRIKLYIYIVKIAYHSREAGYVTVNQANKYPSNKPKKFLYFLYAEPGIFAIPS